MNARKSIVTFVAQIAVIFFGIITTKIVLTVLSPYDFGVFGYAFALSSMIILLADFNLSQVFFKRIAEGANLKEHFSTYCALKSILLLVTLIVFVVYSFLACNVFNSMDMHAWFIFCLIFFSFISDIVLNSFLSILLARREVRVSQSFAVFSAVFTLLFALIFVVPTHSIYLYCMSFLLRSLLGAIFIFILLKKDLVGCRFAFDHKIVNNYIAFVVPLLPVTLISFIGDKIDPLILKVFLSYADVGYFVAAQKLNIFLLLASASLMTILFSAFSEHVATANYRAIEATSNKATKYISLPVTLLSFFVLFNTAFFVETFMSDAFLPAVPIVRFFMLQVIFMSVSRTFDSALLAMERLRYLSVSGLVIGLLGIGLNFVLIPSELFGFRMFGLGACGPAVKLFIIYFAATIVNAIYLFVRFKICVYWRFVLHLMAAMVAGLVLHSLLGGAFVQDYSSFFIAFSAFSLLYFSLLLVMREVTTDDFIYLSRVLNIRSKRSFV